MNKSSQNGKLEQTFVDIPNINPKWIFASIFPLVWSDVLSSIAAHVLLYRMEKDKSRYCCEWRSFSSLPVNHAHMCVTCRNRTGMISAGWWEPNLEHCNRIPKQEPDFQVSAQNTKLLGIEIGSSCIGEGYVLEVCLWTGWFASSRDAHQQGLGIASALLWIPNARWGWAMDDQGGWPDAHCHRAVKTPSLQLQVNEKQVYQLSSTAFRASCVMHMSSSRDFFPLLRQRNGTLSQ